MVMQSKRTLPKNSDGRGLLPAQLLSLFCGEYPWAGTNTAVSNTPLCKLSLNVETKGSAAIVCIFEWQHTSWLFHQQCLTENQHVWRLRNKFSKHFSSSLYRKKIIYSIFCHISMMSDSRNRSFQQ